MSVNNGSEISIADIKDNIAWIIDHTNLHPDATKSDIEKLCKEALKWGTAAVCVHPYYVDICSKILSDSDVEVCTVIGFPLGANKKEVKAFETENALKDGASELDMVINIGALKNRQYDFVEHDIKAVVKSSGDKIVKVILETALLTKDEIIKAAEIAKIAGADFVKTSTGFAAEGATVENVKLMRETVGKNLGVKAAGGIRDYQTALEMVKAGANRIGASSTAKIIAGGQKQSS